MRTVTAPGGPARLSLFHPSWPPPQLHMNNDKRDSLAALARARFATSQEEFEGDYCIGTNTNAVAPGKRDGSGSMKADFGQLSLPGIHRNSTSNILSGGSRRRSGDHGAYQGWHLHM